ncbi:unnamed protein product [Mytilus coruscus]|uniref:Uncharacterized protein n=1 Tax=Mytilus coruscus TaxID=42192 RepID=A0A6J8EY37_MYTCO|nr:unnamed protein product [Mytilus coruscus]
MLISDKEKTLSLLIKLGFIVKLQKHSLVPSQEITYIGALFNFKKEIVDSVLHIIDPQCTPLYEAYPITSTSFLETLHQRSHFSNFIYTTPEGSCALVVGQSKHYQGQTITQVVGNRHNNNRCFKDGILGSHEQSNFSRFLVCLRTESTHKSIGI